MNTTSTQALDKLQTEREALVAESLAITAGLPADYDSTAYAVSCAKLAGLRGATEKIDADMEAIQREIADAT